jgi:hypothetical protein
VAACSSDCTGKSDRQEGEVIVGIWDVWLVVQLAAFMVAACAVFAAVATVAELAFRLPGWAARRLWRRFAR